MRSLTVPPSHLSLSATLRCMGLMQEPVLQPPGCFGDSGWQSFMWSEAAAYLLLLTQTVFGFVFMTGNSILALSFFRYGSNTEVPKISFYWPMTIICGHCIVSKGSKYLRQEPFHLRTELPKPDAQLEVEIPPHRKIQSGCREYISLCLR